MDTRVFWLAVAAFVGAIEGGMIAGLLPLISADFGVSLGQAGLVVLFYSLAYAAGPPALAVMLGAGIDGVETSADHREPVNTNIWEMSYREKRRLRIDDLPHDLDEALDELEKDDIIRAALGAHIATNFLEAKRQEWRDYITQVTRWEIDNYLLKY